MYRLSQKPELLRRFQHGIFGRIQPGGNSSELTIAKTASTTGVLDVSIHCFALGYGDSPLPGGGTAQQFPCCRTQLTKGQMPASNRNTAPRHLSIKSRFSPFTESWMLEIGMVECFNMVNLVHLHLQFLSKQHGQRGVSALPHL